jgi:hypothetical protein
MKKPIGCCCPLTAEGTSKNVTNANAASTPIDCFILALLFGVRASVFGTYGLGTPIKSAVRGSEIIV